MAQYDSLIAGRRNAPLRNAIQEGALRFTYKHHPCSKDPFDVAIYSMLLWQEKPKTIIEIGSGRGGFALWLRDTQFVMGLNALVLSVDLNPLLSEIPGLIFIQGDAHHLDQVFSREWMTGGLQHPLLVIEDSSHEPETTLAVMRYFDEWLRPGELIVIENGNAEDLYPGCHKRGGPLAGVEDFMAERGGSYARAAEYCDFFGQNMTWNPDGYWRRVA
jgi:cephalosporin hydroxylase